MIIHWMNIWKQNTSTYIGKVVNDVMIYSSKFVRRQNFLKIYILIFILQQQKQ